MVKTESTAKVVSAGPLIAGLLILLSVAGHARAATVSIGSASGSCGSAVSVPVTVSGVSGLLAVQFRVMYDTSRLTPAGPAAAVGPMTQGFSISSNSSGGALIVALAGGSPAPGTSGTVAILSFNVNSSAPSGTAALTIADALVNDQGTQGQSGSVAVSCNGGGGGGGPLTGTKWILPSSARVSGAGGVFWRTDLTLRNGSSGPATVYVKFLGHSGDGRDGPEHPVALGGGETRSFRDVLSSLFHLPEGEYGPLLVRSEATGIVALGQTWTAGGGGTYGQSVPVMGSAELVSSAPKAIVGVRQGSMSRTNVVLANPNEQSVEAFVQVVGTSGSVLGSRSVTLGPLGFLQIGNVPIELGAEPMEDGAILVSSRTSGSSIAAYGVLIDQATGDPRTLLAR